jgi:hypothetical protein
MWQSLNTWKQQWQIKISFMKKLGADEIQEMLATIQFRIFCFPVSYPKM